MAHNYCVVRYSGVLREECQGEGMPASSSTLVGPICWQMCDKGVLHRIVEVGEQERAKKSMKRRMDEMGGEVYPVTPPRPRLRGGSVGPSILKAVSTYGKDFSSGHAGSVFLEEPASKSIRWMRADSWEGPVFGPIWEKGMKARDMIAALPPTLLGRGGGRISELGQLHESAWEDVEKPVAGYNYRAEVFVRGTSIIALLDTGASTNAIPEELVVALRWKGSETVTGVARGQDLTIVGAAVMPILFRGQDGREKTQKR